MGEIFPLKWNIFIESEIFILEIIFFAWDAFAME
jgi:hypothetical protein